MKSYAPVFVLFQGALSRRKKSPAELSNAVKKRARLERGLAGCSTQADKLPALQSEALLNYPEDKAGVR